jgi:hypothetical protein
MLTDIVIILAIVVLILIIVIAARPPDFRVTRSAPIAGRPAAVFAQVNDLHLWQAWSPWAKLDPNAKNNYDGPPTGVGSGFAWAGNSKIGEGHMVITESRPNDLVRFRIDFIKPFTATNIAEFTFKPDGDRTVVTWTMTGRCNFVSKAMGLFMNFDKMIGGQFETGLARMDSVVAAATKM